MSAADRDYWREPDPAGPRLHFDLPPVTRVLFFTLIGCFIAQAFNDVYGSANANRFLPLTHEGVVHGWVWQLITFQFLHVNLTHLLGNLLGVWILCTPVERILGPWRFSVAYLGSGVVGGLLQGLLQFAFPRTYGPVVGASAGLEGIFAIFVLLHRDAIFNVMFVLPVRAMTLYYFSAAISVFFTLVPSGLGGGAAHAAHLGGLIFGTLWVRQGWHHDYQPLPGAAWLERLRGLFGARRSNVKRAAAAPRKSPRWDTSPVGSGGNRPAAPARAVDLTSEVDPILDKIAQHGMHSLTESERQKLDEVRRKMTG